MGYIVAGNELETDAEGYLLEPNYSEEVVSVIAAAEGIELTPKHWEVINYMREQYREEGATPIFRQMLKGVNEFWPEAESKDLYDLFPIGPSKQAAKVAGLPQPKGKGGY
ncbi:MAG: TusE/DsrC/DsvC family sulfur relay protein [Gallionellaceae bacterium]|nr:TusE/DsrC/DsvC family sulfur relay protein [Gallionellaceae bacterium]